MNIDTQNTVRNGQPLKSGVTYESADGGMQVTFDTKKPKKYTIDATVKEVAFVKEVQGLQTVLKVTMDENYIPNHRRHLQRPQ